MQYQQCQGLIDPNLNFDPSFLVPPPDSYEYIQHLEQYIYHGKEKKGQRKIYENIHYTQFENEQLEKLQKHLKQTNFELPNGWKISDSLKALYSGQFDFKKTAMNIQQQVKWRSQPLNHQISDQTLKCIQKGFIYLMCRDKQMRPVIVLDCSLLNPKTIFNEFSLECLAQSLSIFMGMVKKYMFVPGVIENWIFMIDTCNIGLFDLPVKCIGAIIDVMQVNFGGCLEKLFILNPSSVLNWSWGLVEKFIDKEAAKKIIFVKKDKYLQLQEFISPQNLLEKYGGHNLALQSIWPPCYKTFYIQNFQPLVLNDQYSVYGGAIIEETEEFNITSKLKTVSGQYNINDKGCQLIQNSQEKFKIQKNEEYQPFSLKEYMDLTTDTNDNQYTSDILSKDADEKIYIQIQQTIYKSQYEVMKFDKKLFDNFEKTLSLSMNQQTENNRNMHHQGYIQPQEFNQNQWYKRFLC